MEYIGIGHLTSIFANILTLYFKHFAAWVQNQSRASSGLMDVCQLVRCLRPLVNSCAQSDQQELCVFSRTHTHSHTGAPCLLWRQQWAVIPVTWTLPAVLLFGRLKWCLASLALDKTELGSDPLTPYYSCGYTEFRVRENNLLYWQHSSYMYNVFFVKTHFFQSNTQHVACEQVLTIILVRQQHMPGSSVQGGSQHEQKQKD